MFGACTEGARKVVLDAQEEAWRRGDGTASGAHPWLALLARQDVMRWLAALGIGAGGLADAMGQRLPPLVDRRAEAYPFIREAKQAMLEWAVEEARAPGPETIRPEHPERGRRRDNQGLAADDNVARAGVPLDDVRRTVATMGEEGI